MSVPNIQSNQMLDSHTRNHFVGHPNIPFGFNNWMPFTRCNKKGIVVKLIQFGHVPESTQHLDSARLDNRTVQQPPVEEPPNQPKKPPVEAPGNLPERPPMPSEPPVEEPPKDPDREPPHKPPVRAMPDMVMGEGQYWSAEVRMGRSLYRSINEGSPLAFLGANGLVRVFSVAPPGMNVESLLPNGKIAV